MRSATAVLLLAIVLSGCPNLTTDSPPVTKVSCGIGNHNNGAGVCDIDNALTLANSVGNNYWECLTSSPVYLFDLSFGSSTTTSGTGTVWTRSTIVPHYPFTWQEGPGTSALSLSENPYFDTIIDIIPASLTAPQSFTATARKNGVNVYSWNCQLRLGSF